MPRILRKKEIIPLIAARALITEAEALRVYNAVFTPEGLLADLLAAGHSIEFRGFGTFERVKRKYSGTQMVRGVRLPIPDGFWVRFKSSPTLKKLTRRLS